jgi:hypothetical protein
MQTRHFYAHLQAFLDWREERQKKAEPATGSAS